MEDVTKEQIRALVDERFALEETPTQQARRLFEEALGAAVLSITHLSQHSASERIRLQASQYVVERNLGPLAAALQGDAADPFREFLADCVAQVGAQDKQEGTDEQGKDTYRSQGEKGQ